MSHYIDLCVRSDPEFPVPLLMNALAAKLHRALVTLQTKNIGVSFPFHRPKGTGLGDVLRLHGTAEQLSALMQTGWIRGMADHISISELQIVPTNALHRVVRRVQAHSSVERIRRRQMKRKGWSEEEARERIPDVVKPNLDLPYLTLRSLSTKQQFRLFIEHTSCQTEAVLGSYNAYGLSDTATVPWF